MQPPPYEYLAERRLLTRKLSFWRIAAAVVAIGAILAVGLRLRGGQTLYLANDFAHFLRGHSHVASDGLDFHKITIWLPPWRYVPRVS